MSIERNAKIMEACIGKTVKSITDTNTGHWSDGNGFIIEFTDGTEAEIDAGEGQGAGFVVVDILQ